MFILTFVFLMQQRKGCTINRLHSVTGISCLVSVGKIGHLRSNYFHVIIGRYIQTIQCLICGLAELCRQVNEIIGFIHTNQISRFLALFTEAVFSYICHIGKSEKVKLSLC
jgi:hypothetical protein